jgi:UDP-N-acetylglucosamine--N-acetylmuramyl-(pentapeptide) pyrophosphoryl-undecaprenol N-acetylglucosamine transferase
VFGGSLGADQINKTVRQVLPEILKRFQVVHVCGEGKIDADCHYEGYKQFAYLHEDFKHILAAADLVVSRSGASSVYELIALRKPSVLIPLAKAFSRGDQILNAQYCVKHGFSEVILSEELTAKCLAEKIDVIEKNREHMIEAIKTFDVLDSVNLIYELVGKYLV